MKLGVAYPQHEVAGDPDGLRRFIKAAEDLGYEYMTAADHVVKATHDRRDPPLNGPYTEKHAFHDPFVLFAFSAAITNKLEFMTGVLVLPQRQTVLVAQQAADLDLLSNERLRLGVGIGWNYVEYDALGQEFRTRNKRIEEQIGFLRQLWSTPLLTFKGRFDRIERAGINPRPKRQIPIWLGGHSEFAYARAGRVEIDGFTWGSPLAVALEGWQSVKRHLNANNRSDKGFGRELVTNMIDTPQKAADAMHAWRDSGGTHGGIATMGRGLGADINAHIDYIAQTRKLIGNFS